MSPVRLAPLAFVLLAAACQQPVETVWEPPGGGVPKGCRSSAQYDEPLVSGIGLSSHLPWGEDEGDTAQRQYEVEQWAQLGVRLVRRDLYWASIEPERGVFDFDGADIVVAAAESVGAEPLGLLVYGNSWATADSDDTMVPPDDPADFGDYAAAVADRYAGRVSRYEVWNEPNAGVRFWKPEEDPEAYGELLSVAADRVHEADPDALVAFGGLFHPDLVVTTPGPEFLEQTFAAVPALADQLDAVAFHPYRYPFTAPEWEDDTQLSLTSDICDLWDLLDDLGASDLELWITELGWHTARNSLVAGVDETDQAAYLVRSALISLAQGCPVYQWYTFRDSGTDSTDQEQMFGLYGHDADPTTDPPAEPKEAAAAFVTLTEMLGDHDRIEDLSEWLGLDGETYAYQLSGGEGTVVVVWTTGEERTVQIPCEDGACEVLASTTPTYLELP